MPWSRKLQLSHGFDLCRREYRCKKNEALQMQTGHFRKKKKGISLRGNASGHHTYQQTSELKITAKQIQYSQVCLECIILSQECLDIILGRKIPFRLVTHKCFSALLSPWYLALSEHHSPLVKLNMWPMKSHQILCIFYFSYHDFFQLTHVIFYIFAIKHEYNSF